MVYHFPRIPSVTVRPLSAIQCTWLRYRCQADSFSPVRLVASAKMERLSVSLKLLLRSSCLNDPNAFRYHPGTGAINIQSI